MEPVYTYLLLGIAAGCAAGGSLGWWLRKQGEAARQHDVEVYYREALKISETARDRAREESEQSGERLRELRDEHDARAGELEDLQTFVEGLKQAGTDSTSRVSELDKQLTALRGRLKEREAAVTRLQKEWKAREAKLTSSRNGHGERERLQAELRAMTDARAASGAEADRLRKRVVDLEAQVSEVAKAAGNGNGNGHRKGNAVAVTGNGAPKWLLASANGDQDDLKSIHGLGPVLERGLNKLGVYYFRQVARMTRKDVEWLAPHLNIHPGRILRADWARQAKECHLRKYKEKL